MRRHERERVYDEQRISIEQRGPEASELVPLRLPRNLLGMADQLDRVYIALVSRFRRIPNLRLFVIFYVVVMQLVMIAFLLHYRRHKA